MLTSIDVNFRLHLRVFGKFRIIIKGCFVSSGSRPSDGGRSQKNFFLALWAQFGLNIRGGPDTFPGSVTV